tara:strand:- start:369 stop:830 length:462 start_codon:yes stop_codon:yes gene_type:complete
MSGNGRGIVSLGDGTQKRELVLSLLRQGHTRGEAAELAGVHRVTLWRQLRRDAEFLDDVVSAEQEALDPKFLLLEEWINDDSISIKDRHNMLRTFLQYKHLDQKNDVTIKHQHTHELTVGGDQLDRVLALQQELEQRALGQPEEIVIEVEDDD